MSSRVLNRGRIEDGGPFELRVRCVAEPERVAAEGYRTAIRYMDAACFPADTRTRPNVRRGWWWIVQDERGVLAGYAGLDYWYADDLSRGYLARAGVMPQFRGFGLQRRLIRVREQRARREGMGRMVTYAGVENVHSINNLVRSGYLAWNPARTEPGFIYFFKDL